MYVKRKNAPSHLINTISNDRYASMFSTDQQHYEYLLGEVKKDKKEIEDHIEIRPDILGRSEIIHTNSKPQANAGSNNQS